MHKLAVIVDCKFGIFVFFLGCILVERQGNYNIITHTKTT